MKQILKRFVCIFFAIGALFASLQSDDLPPCGYGFIDLLRNESKYPAKVFFEKNINDNLPPQSVVRIKSLDNDKYYRVYRDKSGAVFCVADSDDKDGKKDPGTLFIVKRYVDYNLNDRITFASDAVRGCVMSIDDKGKLVFQSSVFEDPDLSGSHWVMVPENIEQPLDALFLTNLSNQGALHTVTKEEEYLLEPEVTKPVDCVLGATLPLIDDDIITYGSIITILSPGDTRSVIPTKEYMWVCRSEPFGIKTASEILFCDAADSGWKRRSSTGRFMILDPKNPGNRGSVACGDKVLIYSLFNNVSPEDPEPMRIIFPDSLAMPGVMSISQGEGLWRSDGRSRHGGTHASLVNGGDKVTFSQINDKMKFMFFAAPTAALPSKTDYVDAEAKVSGLLKRNIPVIIKSCSDDMRDSDGSSNLWRNSDSRYGAGHHEIIIKDQWGVDRGNNRSRSLQAHFILDKADDERVRSVVLEGRADPADENMQKFLKGITKSIRMAYKMPEMSQLFIKGGGSWALVDASSTMNIARVAAYKKDDVWGITSDKSVIHFNGITWTDMTVKALDISVGSDGIPWRTGLDNKVYCKNGLSWDLMLGESKSKPVSIAARTKDEAWVVLDDGSVMQYKKGQGFQKIDFTGGRAADIDVTDYDGAVWVVSDVGELYRYRNNAWKQLPGNNFSCIAVQSETEAWACDKNRQVFHWDGKAWVQISSLYLSSISISHGIELAKPKKTAMRTVTTAYTTDLDGETSYPKKPDARVAIKIEQLGVGAGGVEPKSTMPFAALPVAKKPKISGFVDNTLKNFTESSMLDLAPLINRGVAWLEQSFQTPGKASISFLANAETADIQVVFGDATTQDALCRVTIGAHNNHATTIQVRTGTEAGEPIFTTVYEVSDKQNPFAVASPGNFAPYIVSVNDGLVLAFRGGLDGEVIAAYTIPQDDAFKVPLFVGLSSNDKRIQYTEIKVGDPIDILPPGREYFNDAEKGMPVSGPAIAWTNFPFRIPDQGAFGFSVKAAGTFSIAFGTKKDQTFGHYGIIIGEDDLKIQKWDIKAKKYIDLIKPVNISTLTNFDLKNEAKPLWVSYAEGVIMVGGGAFGEDVTVIANDPAPYLGIGEFGFAAPEGAVLTNFTVAPQVTLGYKVGEQFYKKPRQLPKFSGSMKIILPFEYWLAQEKKSSLISCFDAVTKNMTVVQNTPQQGALYHYAVKLDGTGALSLGLIGEPENPVKDKMLQDALDKKMEAEKKLIEAGQSEAAGALAQQLAIANGDVDRAKAAAGMQTANFLRDTGATLIQAASTIPLPTAMMVIAGVGTVAAVGSMVRAGLTEMDLRNAADKEFAGAQQFNKAKQDALIQQGQAQMLQLAAKQAEEKAQAAFKAVDAAGYVDEAKMREIGSQSIPDEAKGNRANLEEMLKTVNTTQDLVQVCMDMLNVIDHPYVTQETGTKKAVWQTLEKLKNWFMKNSATFEPSVRSDVMNTLFSALNNSYLADDTWRGNCYQWINAIVKDVLEVKQQKEIVLAEQYGEYIWLPFVFPAQDQGALLIQAVGQHDLFVCLSAERNKRMRDSEIELYEILFGGMGNTKTSIRLKNLGKPVKEITKKTTPAAMLDEQDAQTYWISYANGFIEVGKDEPGKNKLFEWKDPYPLTGIRYIGLSCWDAPVVVANMSVAKDVKSLLPAWQKLKDTASLESSVVEDDAQTEVTDAEQLEPQSSEELVEDVGEQVITGDASDVVEVEQPEAVEA